MPVRSFNDAICPKSQVSRVLSQDIEMLHLDLPGTKKITYAYTTYDFRDISDIPCFHLAQTTNGTCDATQGVFTWLLVFAELGSQKTLHGRVSQGRETYR